MRIVRFRDPAGEVHLGCDYDGATARRLAGRLFHDLQPTDERLPVARLLAPLTPTAILCIGLNYRDHAAEFQAPPPAHPILFMKNPAAVIGPGAPIVLPRCCDPAGEVDYEAELVAVLGRPVKDASEEEALAAVFGYTCGNDVSARRWQKEGGGGQWVRGKSFDTFCPLGPELVTADEIPDLQDLAVSCRVNGELLQQGNTRDMLFPVARLIAFLSQDTTLLPGTAVMTGTPPGVGFARTPPRWLHPGDRVAVTIDHLGTLENPVTAAGS